MTNQLKSYIFDVQTVCITNQQEKSNLTAAFCKDDSRRSSNIQQNKVTLKILQPHFGRMTFVVFPDDDDAFQFDVSGEGNVEQKLLVRVRRYKLKHNVSHFLSENIYTCCKLELVIK